MIYRLEIENFYSFRDRQVVDLTVGRRNLDNPGRLVEIQEGSVKRAPLVVAIYGANASGKSNVLRAVSFLKNFIGSSVNFPAAQPLYFTKFGTNESIAEETHLSMEFSSIEYPSQKANQTCSYFYNLKISPDNLGRQVTSESMSYRPKGSPRKTTIFKRQPTGKVSFPTQLATDQERLALEQNLRPNASVISTLGKLGNRLSQNIVGSMNSIHTSILYGISNSNPTLATLYSHDYEMLESLNQNIHRLDLGVKQVYVWTPLDHPIIQVKHNELDMIINYEHESNGTQRFIYIFPILYYALKSGGIAVIDEVDAMIHPTFMPEILRWFEDPNRNPLRAQLWISCHSATLMDGLLKEEVLICEKDDDGASHVFRLGDISNIKDDEGKMRNYLVGAYGGVPDIG